MINGMIQLNNFVIKLSQRTVLHHNITLEPIISVKYVKIPIKVVTLLILIHVNPVLVIIGMIQLNNSAIRSNLRTV